jgi:hypothetical protein
MDSLPSELELESASDEDRLVHEWRSWQLQRLGVSVWLADLLADSVDWHAVEALVSRGCAPRIAVEIVR